MSIKHEISLIGWLTKLWLRLDSVIMVLNLI